MTAHLRAWLEKAVTVTTADFIAPTGGGYLSPQQVREFLRVAVDASVLVTDMRQESSLSPKFEVPRISLNERLLRNGTEAVRIAADDRKKPLQGLVTLSTALFKGEVLVSDETFEDNVEGDGYADTLAAMIAQAVGRDVEEIAIKSDTDRTGGEDTTLDQFDGIIKGYQDGLPVGQQLDMTGIDSPLFMFRMMLENLPAKYRRNLPSLRFYVPVLVADEYHAELANRQTPGGDGWITDDGELRFRGIPVVPIPLLTGEDTVDSGAIDYGTFAWLTDPKNTIIGWHRRVRVEKFRDPREGATSFLPSVRFDVKHANPEAAVLAYSIGLAVPAGS